MKHDEEWLIENIPAYDIGREGAFDLATAYAEHMTANAETKIAELEADNSLLAELMIDAGLVHDNALPLEDQPIRARLAKLEDMQRWRTISELPEPGQRIEMAIKDELTESDPCAWTEIVEHYENQLSVNWGHSVGLTRYAWRPAPPPPDPDTFGNNTEVES